jgi:hypothetical protein
MAGSSISAAAAAAACAACCGSCIFPYQLAVLCSLVSIL